MTQILHKIKAYSASIKGDKMNLILTSTLDLYLKNEADERIPHNFGNKNGILDLIKQLTPKQDNFVYVASVADDYDITDYYANLTFDSFKSTFPFKSYIILDGRTKGRAKEIIENADLIFLCGGHVPTQNNFYTDINLREIIKNTDALIIGQSAGSMDSAEIVYAQPELEGESIDPNYKKYIKGLGLTNISILPHFEERFDWILDGKNIFKEITLPDSEIRPFLAYSDGTFIYDNGVKQLVYGKSYLFDNGSFQQISEDDSITDITELIENKFGNYAYETFMSKF